MTPNVTQLKFLGTGVLWNAVAEVGEGREEDLPDETLPPESETSCHHQENICQNLVNILSIHPA